MPSKYDSIWKQLKEKSHCAITAPVPLHPRIIKAVIKRKDVDSIFKLELYTKCKRVRLSYKVDGSRIRFFLSYYTRFDLLTEKEL